MHGNTVVVVDLGQSGTRIRFADKVYTTDRGKLAGEKPSPTPRATFEEIEKLGADIASLSCTGFHGVVPNPDHFASLGAEFFGTRKVAVIDDGLEIKNGDEAATLAIRTQRFY